MMQGIVLNIDLKSDKGLVKADDGKRYEFQLDRCVQGYPLIGNTVDFELSDNQTVDGVCVIKSSKKSILDWLYWFLFSVRGRISRDQFLAYLAVALFVLPFPMVAAAWAGLPLMYFVLVWAGLIYVNFAVVIKRFHDSGSSSFWLFFTAILGAVAALALFKVVEFPFVTDVVISILCSIFGLFVLFCIYMCLAKGNLGENKYGKEPASCKTIRLK